MKKDENMVQVYPDALANGIWDSEGRNMDYERLPVSQEIINDLKEMSALYDKHDQSHFEVTQKLYDFNLMSKRIAKKIKKELPDWKVYFFDDRVKFVEVK